MSKFDADRDASLIELYQKSRRQIECTGNSIQQKNTRRAAWEAIAKTINDEHQTYFTMEQCKKRWHNIKYVAKVQNTVKRKYSKKSESGHLSDQKPFASISSKVLEIREKTPGSSSDDNGEISTSPVTSKQFLHDSLLIPFSLSEPISSKSTFLLEAPLPQTSTTSSQHCYNNVINKKQKLSDTADVISKKPKLTMDDIREKQMEVLNAQLKEIKENAILREKQSQLLEKQMVATESCIQLMELFKKASKLGNFLSPQSQEQSR